MEPAAMFERFKVTCLAHPDTCLTMTWGSPHFRIGGDHGKIFAGCGADKDGTWSIGVRVEPDLQAALVASDPRFKVAAYVGKYGGVDFTPGPSPDWGEVEMLVATSYKIIAGGMTRGAGGRRKAPPMKSRRSAAPKPAAAKRKTRPKGEAKAKARAKPRGKR